MKYAIGIMPANAATIRLFASTFIISTVFLVAAARRQLEKTMPLNDFQLLEPVMRARCISLRKANSSDAIFYEDEIVRTHCSGNGSGGPPTCIHGNELNRSRWELPQILDSQTIDLWGSIRCLRTSS